MASADTELTCIVCPNGCTLTVASTDGGLVVTGNKCPKGEEYAQAELSNPTRTVTAVVPTDSDDFPCVPVKTDTPVAKDSIPMLLKELYSHPAKLPVKRGDCHIDNAAGTGARIVFTRTMPPSEGP